MATDTKVEFLSADWNDLKNNKYFNSYSVQSHQLVADNKYEVQAKSFDLIFGADILYEVETYITLLEMFDNLLTDKGRVIIISKMYYYGNGGSLYEFQDYVEKSKKFKHQSLKVINDNTSNRREIILLERTSIE